MKKFSIEKRIEITENIQAYLLDVTKNNVIDLDLIPRTQLAEINKYKKAIDRDKRLLSRSFLFDYLSEKYRITNFEFDYNKYQKPFLRTLPRIHFSFSYANNYVLIAISEDAEIGVDIEYIDPKLKIREIALEVMCVDEWKQFNSYNHDPISKYHFFYRLFSSKEATIKAFGKGLYFDVKSLNTVNHTELIYKNKMFTCMELELWKNRYTLAICFETKSS